MKVIIVGGVAGGATAAARIRRLNEHAEITVFERSGYISYANCGLPYYIGDVITEPEELTLQTPESFFKRFRINMKIHHEVISIHSECKTVSVKNLENGEIFEENYDKLILSPGAKPTQPRLPGVGIDKLFTLRTVEDTFRIKEYINKNHPKSAVLAGGGFIGLELAENLRGLGMDVTIVQRPKQLMNPFDPDMASMIHNEMRKHGIKLVLGYTVEGFKEKDNGVEVLLKDNPSLQADMVVLAIGVTPDTVLAKEAGLELGIKESIVVNDRMETSVPDIYAAGDAVQVKHYVTGNDTLEDMDKISKDKSVVLLDVRTVGEFNRGHMDGFRNIPVDELRERINEIEKGKPVYLICQSGLRSYIASRILEGNGYETYNFSGGFRFYDAVVNDRALIERAYACGMDY